MKTSHLVACSLAITTTLLLSDASVARENFVTSSQKEHEIVLLNHGLGSLEKRLELIERANESIDVEYFIYRTDKSAKIFTQALVKKAREGVKVRMLLDYFMVKSDLDVFYTHELAQEGIEVKYYNTTSTLNLFSGQYRNHRKVLIIDGKEAITGGRNIGDEYFDLHAEYNFLDRDIYLKGEIVEPIKKSFDKTFANKLSEKVQRDKKPDRYDSLYNSSEGGFDFTRFEQDLSKWNKREKLAKDFVNQEIEASLNQNVKALGMEALSQEFHGTCKNISFYSEYPDLGKDNRRNDRVLKYDLFKRISNAKESILIDSPYFIINDELGNHIKDALGRKTKIELLTNSLNSTDAIYVYANFDSNILPWIQSGLDAYIYKGYRDQERYKVIESASGKAKFGVHSKTFVFDNKDVIVGTYNVDPRSANYNSEMYIVCEDAKELAKAVTDNVHERMEKSFKLNNKKDLRDLEFYNVGFSKKILYYFTKLPAEIFDYLL